MKPIIRIISIHFLILFITFILINAHNHTHWLYTDTPVEYDDIRPHDPHLPADRHTNTSIAPDDVIQGDINEIYIDYTTLITTVSSNKSDSSNSSSSSYTTTSSSSSNIVVLSYVPTPQDQVKYKNADEWACGLSSLSRITKQLGYSTTFEGFLDIITPFALPIDINMCSLLGLDPFGSWYTGSLDFCNVHFEIPPWKYKMGNPAPLFANKINSWVGSSNFAKYEAYSSTSAGLNRVHQLIDQGRPVIVNILVSMDSQGTESVDLGPFGSHSISFQVPMQHYIVVYGYTESTILYHDTDATSHEISNTEFLALWGWQRHGYSRYKNFATAIIYNLGCRPLTLIYLQPQLPHPSPGCACDCCGCSSVCFCLVPCGCACNVPDSHEIDIVIRNTGDRHLLIAVHYVEISPNFYNSRYTDWGYEGQWRLRYWYRVDPGEYRFIARTQNRLFYLHAYDPSTGVYYGRGDRSYAIDNKVREFSLYDAGSSLGVNKFVTYDPSIITTPPNYRIFVTHNADHAERLYVIIYYYDRFNREWTFYSKYLSYGQSIYMGSTTYGTIYYYGESTNGYFKWEGSLEREYGGERYRLREYSLGSPHREVSIKLTTTCTPRNCAWGSWGPWGACEYDASFANSASGGFIRKRYRGKRVSRNACGEDCTGSNTDYASCEDPCASNTACGECTSKSSCGWCQSTSTCRSGDRSNAKSETCSNWDWYSSQCTVDCQVSAWSGWSGCSAHCDQGTQFRTRTVVINPQNGGAICPPLSEERPCKIRDCTSSPTLSPTQSPTLRLCQVSAWSEWSECSAHCDQGTQFRTRTVVINPQNGAICPPLSEERPCKIRDCTSSPTQSPTLPSEGSLSFTSSAKGDTQEGRLYIYVNYSWGTICNRGFQNVSATVACTQMMGKGSEGYVIPSASEDVSEPIHISNVQCSGDEVTLMDCAYSHTTQDCIHDEDVSIKCTQLVLAHSASTSPSGAVVISIVIVVVIIVVAVLAIYCGCKKVYGVCQSKQRSNHDAENTDDHDADKNDYDATKKNNYETTYMGVSSVDDVSVKL